MNVTQNSGKIKVTVRSRAGWQIKSSLNQGGQDPVWQIQGRGGRSRAGWQIKGSLADPGQEWQIQGRSGRPGQEWQIQGRGG